MTDLVREYRRDDAERAQWGRGEWNEEPDKVQWVDAATGLDCLINRGPLGALCGYVGVPEGHPAFAKDYDGITADVHGGLTFAEFCGEPTRERWERWRERALASKAEASRYPVGDAARNLELRGHMIDDFEAWKAWGESAFICHVPFEGRPAHVWWLGFDCSHSGDYTPGMNVAPRSFSYGDETYCTVDYVKREVTRLAEQLATQQAA